MGDIPSTPALFCVYNAVNRRVIGYLVLALGLEGCAVGALGHGGVRLVGNYLDLGKRAVVLLTAMVGALGHGAADGLVGGVAVAASAAVLVLVHFSFSFRDIVFFAGVSFCLIIVSDFKKVIQFFIILLTKGGVCAIVKLQKYIF